jgi:AhpD family alkylhydroperoxidase
MNRIPDPDMETLPPELAKQISEGNLNLFKIWAYSVSSIKDVISLGADHYAGLELAPHIRELIILLTAHLNKCEYEWVQHVTPAKTFGVTEGQIASIEKVSFSEDNFNPQEMAAMKFTMAVLSDPQVSDDAFQLAQSHFSNRELVEIVELIGYYWMAGRIATVFKLDLDVPKSTEVNDSAQLYFKKNH